MSPAGRGGEQTIRVGARPGGLGALDISWPLCKYGNINNLLLLALLAVSMGSWARTYVWYNGGTMFQWPVRQ